MDPNKALFDLRELCALGEDADALDPRVFTETFQALDEWLTKGGFPPHEWAPAFAGGDAEPTEPHSYVPLVLPDEGHPVKMERELFDHEWKSGAAS